MATLNKTNTVFNFLCAVRNAWRKSGYEKAQEKGEILARHLRDYKPPVAKDTKYDPKPQYVIDFYL